MPRIRQYCPACDELVDATLAYEHEDGVLTFDTSFCGCGFVLWRWAYDPTAPKAAPPPPPPKPADPDPVSTQLSLW